MKQFIGDQKIATDDELVELALGFGVDPELWLGPDTETNAERAARLTAAADMLAEDPSLAAPLARLTARAIESYLAKSEFVRAVSR
ncbi:hypothetical protein RM844_27530 [Streptomyces sp. DSM 44915]|uniref:Transcriptional regulator n=1 Tax=Streptomyces chisholmiae TaxID=3075540 RepID=A0ABU2JYW7_9ACTN|nr:hypothetical protein [Streptomyces sp. DSM 44915]MDT0270037.1 hypothetical protein [Streptomyces sp. DSM 44915]